VTPARLRPPRCDRTTGRVVPRAVAPRHRSGIWVAGKRDRARPHRAGALGEPQAIMRFVGTGREWSPDFVPRGGFADGTTPVGKVSAMGRYPWSIRIVVRPTPVLLTPVPAALC